MHILKRGTANIRCCKKCGSELQFDDTDLKIEHDPNKCMGPYEMDIEPEDFYDVYINCPVCPDSKIYISSTRYTKSLLINKRKQNDRY